MYLLYSEFTSRRISLIVASKEHLTRINRITLRAYNGIRSQNLQTRSKLHCCIAADDAVPTGLSCALKQKLSANTPKL